MVCILFYIFLLFSLARFGWNRISYIIADAFLLFCIDSKPQFNPSICYWWWQDMRAILHYVINTLRPRRNEQHFADDIFKRIFINENVWIAIKILLKFVPKGPVNNIPSLVQIMTWRRRGDKPLSEPRMESLLTRICVTRPQWVNGGFPTQKAVMQRFVEFVGIGLFSNSREIPIAHNLFFS